jgi:hypothetical protein
MGRRATTLRLHSSCALAVALASLPCGLTLPARMWRVVNTNRVEIDWSVSELQFLSRTVPAPYDQRERTGEDWPIGAADWQTPFACDDTSALSLTDFPGYQLLSSFDYSNTPVEAAFDGAVEFARSDGTSLWRSGVHGAGLNASAGYIGVDFATDVDVRCVRLTQGPRPKWGSEVLQLQSSADGSVWEDVLTSDALEYPHWEQGTLTLVITECQRAVPISTNGVLNFTGGFTAPLPLDCSWVIECAADEVATLQISELQTTRAQELMYAYDGPAYLVDGLGPGERPALVDSVAQVQNELTQSFHGTLPACVEDKDGLLGDVGLDCSDGTQCQECIPTWRGCRTGTSVEACPPVGTTEGRSDGRNSTCIAGSPETVHSGLNCADCYASCPSALFKLGSCGGDINTLNPAAPEGTLLSAVCPNLCHSTCPGDIQSTVPTMAIRYTGDGLGEADSGFVGRYTCAPLDECGVSQGLGGDSTTCAGCDGVPNSGKVLDWCGVCDGDGSTCLGCDAVPHSGLEFDNCGVCGGDRGSSCADPCASPHGMHMEIAGSIDFGSGYSANHQCEWHFFCPAQDDHVLISFARFNTEINWDYVEFFEGPEVDQNSPLIDPATGASVGQLSGSSVPGPFQSAGTSLSMTFTTNQLYNRDGWLMQFACGSVDTAITAQDPCVDGVHLVDGGQIDFLGGYGPHIDCAWILSCSDPLLHPRLSFGRFHTQENHDFVYIYDYEAELGGAASWQEYLWQAGNLMGTRRSGNDGPEPVIGSAGSLTVRFTSDGDVTTEGFDALYSCESSLNVG